MGGLPLFDRTFKNIDDTLWKDAGCSSELDYVEQTSWILFLKYLGDFEKERKKFVESAGRDYIPILSPEYRWDAWAASKDGIKTKRTGEELLKFVNYELFPYLKQFKKNADCQDSIESKIGEIFCEVRNKLQSGYTLRDVIDLVDELSFNSREERHQMSVLYEDKIKYMGNAGRNGGEYYTPRPLIKTIVKLIAPQIGETVYDGALGSAGFLVESYEYMNGGKELTTVEKEILQKKTFYGKEKKSLAYTIATMNMILHGIEVPHILHTNTLAENLAAIPDSERYDVILANPPFGGKERGAVQNNFPIKTSESASLFLQHFIKVLEDDGRAGIVIKNTFLSNKDRASISLRKHLLQTCSLHTILCLPGGVFTGAGVKTIVLFFTKGRPTNDIWFYQLNLERNLGKTNPLIEADLEDFVQLYKTRSDSANSWKVRVEDINQETFDLSARNPHLQEEIVMRDPREILAEMKALDQQSRAAMKELDRLL